MKAFFRCLPAWALLLMFTVSCQSRHQSLLSSTAQPLSLRMADSELRRHPTPFTLDGMKGPRWNYTGSIEVLAIQDLYRATGNQTYWDYAFQYADTLIASDGEIRTYTLENYNIDHVCPARTLFEVYRQTGEERFRKAMETAFTQLQQQPRTSDGGFWHKAVYPWQMWLDGLYMGEPFYARYVATFIPEDQRLDYFKDIVHQFVTVAKHTYDPQTGVYRHGWDESRQQFWCDPETGQSEHCWSRGLGWYVMGMVDALDYIPEEAGRQQVIDILNGIYQSLQKYADRKTGMWYQVLECPDRKGNWLESTGSIMFVYGLLKGIDTGIFSKEYTFLAKEWYERFVRTFVRENEDGTISITQCCAGAGLGGSDQTRSGKFDYYVNGTRIIENDCKAVGPFIWSSLYYENLE